MPRYPSTDFLCYLLYSVDTGKIYVGSTDNIHRRLHQHNHTSQGAKYTKKYRPWVLAAVVRGFATHAAALQFEWAWQNPHKSKHLKLHRQHGYISRYNNRCFANWYKAAHFLCCTRHWRAQNVSLTGYFLPSANVEQLSRLTVPDELLQA